MKRTGTCHVLSIGQSKKQDDCVAKPFALSSSMSSATNCLKLLKSTEIRRPVGMVDWMHYDYLLRSGGSREPVAGSKEWCLMESLFGTLHPRELRSLLSIGESRPWAVGKLGLLQIAESLWDQLTPIGRGELLAGASSHLEKDAFYEVVRAEFGLKQPGWGTSEWMVTRMPSVTLTAATAAEIGANAIRAGSKDLLSLVLDRSEVTSGRISRYSGYREQERFEQQLLQLSTGVLDVLLETAVRCCNPEAMRLLLVQGANPNMPCWLLERSYSEWYCALSYSLDGHFGSGRPEGLEMVETLLEFGADPQGLACEGRNNPLMHALRRFRWDWVDRLLSLGARFEGGLGYAEDECTTHGERLIPAGHALIGYSKEDLEWVQHSIRPLVPMLEVWQVPLFYDGNGQGGRVTTFLSCLLMDEHLPMLRKYAGLGLATAITPTLFLDVMDGGHYEILYHLLRDNKHLGRVMYRVRRRKPDFGASRKQLHLCRPEADGSNVLAQFESYGQTPLQLPDGSRVYAYLDCVAPPCHDHGPVTEGAFWILRITATFRRRRDRLSIRDLRQVWKLEAVPTHNRGVPVMLPLVKEADGKFVWLGVNLDSLRYHQKVPASWRPVLDEWLEGGPVERIVQWFLERCVAQKGANLEFPRPVLSSDELDPYPRELWPFLRRFDDGTIGMTPDSCQPRPAILELYADWARQSKPDPHGEYDQRLLNWKVWPQIPLELRPFFAFDELFGKPTVRRDARNAYENAMIRKAVRWNNEVMMQALKSSGI